MIVFEEKMRELVKLLPNARDAKGSLFVIRYGWGSQDELNKFLLLPETVSKYPLIWLIAGKTTRNDVTNKLSRNTRLVIATRASNKNSFNATQYATDYVSILNPVYINLKTLLNSSGITKVVNNTIEEDLRPNYSFNDNGKGVLDIWNAIVLDLQIEMLTDRCVNSNIKF
jgi:hypothetical protein